MFKWPLIGWKKKIHRDKAGMIFLDHCRVEAEKLKNALVPELFSYCDGQGNPRALDAITSLPPVRLVDDKPSSKARPLLDAHCLALTTAVGMESIRRHIDPTDQSDVMIRIVSKLIIGDDVGAENVGHAPNPWPTPHAHVLYIPGTFVGGIPSHQQKITERYRQFHTAPEQLVALLVGLHLFFPSVGICKAIYSEENLGHGIIGKNIVGTIRATSEEMGSWHRDLKITDAAAALAELPPAMAQSLLSAIDGVDRFWPTYCRHHKLTW